MLAVSFVICSLILFSIAYLFLNMDLEEYLDRKFAEEKTKEAEIQFKDLNA